MDTLFDSEGVLVVNVGKVERILDPRGMIKTDIKYIRSQLPQLKWTKDMSLTDIAYLQGQYDLLDFIETKVIGRRVG